MEKYRI